MPDIVLHNGSFLRDLDTLDADDVYAELERIRRAHGGTLTAEAVVEAARNPASVLHPLRCWCWDNDEEAARRYRLAVARRLIRVVCVLPDESRSPRPVPVYAHVRTDEARGYRPVTLVSACPAESASAIDEFLVQIRALIRSLETLCRHLTTGQARKLRKLLSVAERVLDQARG